METTPGYTHLEANNEEELWKAVLARNHLYDSTFVYGVFSTGVCCRPSCPSRGPAREQVVFFSESILAEKAGFRACLRCKPDDKESPFSRGKLVEGVCNYIDENLDGDVTLMKLSEQTGISQYHLQRTFKRMTGITPRQYGEATRLNRAKLWLRGGESVRKSIYRVGHNSTSWLYSGQDSKLGMHPATYKNGGKGLHIYYSIVDCSLGKLLVAGTQRGICSVCLGNSTERLEAALSNEYPRANIHRDETKPASWVNTIREYLDSEEIVHLGSLPLDIRATSFQYKVWKELQSIPYGSTRSYSEVAQRISSSNGSRAVANVCAQNRAALVIPCHRVVRKDGILGGYRWGTDRKETILEKERRNLAKSAED
jgi:AraC family transcriptional regulator of adaptative response/methylated-DNA-[protein]-cysteine methyltransferase